MAKNPVHHNKTKHITIKYHFIREAEATKEIKLDYYRTEDQIADILTNVIKLTKIVEIISNSEDKIGEEIKTSIKKIK